MFNEEEFLTRVREAIRDITNKHIGHDINIDNIILNKYEEEDNKYDYVGMSKDEKEEYNVKFGIAGVAAVEVAYTIDSDLIQITRPVPMVIK